MAGVPLIMITLFAREIRGVRRELRSENLLFRLWHSSQITTLNFTGPLYKQSRITNFLAMS